MNPVSGGYWPWWLGALALGAVAVGHWLLVGRLLGVSGVYLRLIKLPGELRASRAERALLADGDALAAALEAATLAEIAAQLDPQEARAFLEQTQSEPAADGGAVTLARPPWTAHLVLVLAIAAGGALSALTSGGLRLRPELGAELLRLWGAGPGSWSALFFGGVLTGFGTCLAGGCTSGHGLSGCSRLQPGSLLATAAFFGTGVAGSLALARWFA